MTNKLKFTVSFGRTINLGNYSTARLGISKEFFYGLHSVEEAYEEVKGIVDGLVRRDAELNKE